MAVVALVPALNEARSIGAVVGDLRDLGLDVIVVDDGSQDDTWSVAREAGATVLRLPVNLGVGGALRLGFRFACVQGYDAVVQCDGDGQHPPYEVPRLLEHLEETGADMVVGSRFAADDDAYRVGMLRRLAMRILGRVASRATGTTISDATSGFRAVRGDLLRGFARTYPVEYLGDTVEALVMAGHAGYRVSELPVRMRHREHGTSSAGDLASLWFTLRVLVAVVLRPEQLPARAT